MWRDQTNQKMATTHKQLVSSLRDETPEQFINLIENSSALKNGAIFSHFTRGQSESLWSAALDALRPLPHKSATNSLDKSSTQIFHAISKMAVLFVENLPHSPPDSLRTIVEVSLSRRCS